MRVLHEDPGGAQHHRVFTVALTDEEGAAFVRFFGPRTTHDVDFMLIGSGDQEDRREEYRGDHVVLHVVGLPDAPEWDRVEGLLRQICGDAA